MPQLLLQLNTFTRDFPHYTFVQDIDFMWSPISHIISYPHLDTLEDLWSLLHEIAHAELGHDGYDWDVELIRRESEAWDHAAHVLALSYDTTIHAEHVENSLDTYRVWLDQRSRCPECGQNGFQTTTNTYNCINCRCLWRVNEARVCRLQRTKLQDQNRSE